MGVGAEAAVQAPRRVLAPPVHLLPVRVPVGLGLVVKTPGEAGVVPPVVVVFLRPGEAEGQRPGLGESTSRAYAPVPRGSEAPQVLAAASPDPKDSARQSPPSSGVTASQGQVQTPP